MSLSSNFPTIKPSLNLDFANTKRLDPRVTFTRSTTGTYYDGVTTAKAEENLVYYSQEFDNGVWTPVNTSIVANNTTAPDGTATADKVVIAANTSYHDAFANAFPRVANQQYTHSIYVKAGTGIPAVYFYTNRDAVGLIAKFDISAGTYIGNAGADGYAAFDSYSITSVGSGWYRITATFTAASNSNSTFTLGISTTTTNTVVPITGNGTDFCYIWGAQLEQRSSATAYTVTTTQPITNYIPVLLTAAANVPRFDHNPTTDESLGLLIEEQRTNLSLYSSQFDNAQWTQSGATITANTVVAPDGTITGDKIVENTSNAAHYLFQLSSAAAGTYSLSAYMKAAGRSFGWLYAYTGASATAYFDLANGTVGTVSGTYSPTATITSVGNGWYRCTMTFAATDSNFNFGAGVATANGTNSYTGDGFSGIFIWGAQLEAASFPTSYIATTSLAVTRTADAASMTGTNFTSWFNAGAGTFYGEANLSGSGRYFHTVKTGSSAQIEGVQQTTYFEAFVYTTDIQAQINISASSFINRRVAMAYQVNDIAACVSGGAVSVDTNAILPLDLNAFYVNSYGTSGPLGSGTVKKVAYYPARLTNAQLQAITS